MKERNWEKRRERKNDWVIWLMSVRSRVSDDFPCWSVSDSGAFYPALFPETCSSFGGCSVWFLASSSSSVMKAAGFSFRLRPYLLRCDSTFILVQVVKAYVCSLRILFRILVCLVFVVVGWDLGFSDVCSPTNLKGIRVWRLSIPDEISTVFDWCSMWKKRWWCGEMHWRCMFLEWSGKTACCSGVGFSRQMEVTWLVKRREY